MVRWPLSKLLHASGIVTPSIVATQGQAATSSPNGEMITAHPRVQQRARTMKRVIVSALGLSLALAPISSCLSAPVFPQIAYADQGGRLGITLEGPYDWRGINVFRITDIDRRSSLYGSVNPGDFIYGVNGFNLRDVSDVVNIVGSGSPGSTLSVYFLDSRHGYAAMRINAVTHLLPAQVSPTSTARSSQQNTSYCGEHPVLCMIGGAIAIGAAASAAISLTSGGDGSSSSEELHSCARDGVPCSGQHRDDYGNIVNDN